MSIYNELLLYYKSYTYINKVSLIIHGWYEAKEKLEAPSEYANSRIVFLFTSGRSMAKHSTAISASVQV